MNNTNKRTAKNPITLIAIFAGIAEIAMTVTLLKLPDEQMSTFIWFVMVFPILLVSAFFYVLLKKPESLYAPSDYKNDSAFLKSLGIEDEVSGINDKIDRLEQLVVVLKGYVEKLVEQVAPEKSGKIIEEQNSKFSEVNRFYNLMKNNLFSFLHIDLDIDENSVLSAISSVEDIRDLPKKILEKTNDSRKEERVSRLIDRFPRVHLDFNNLRKEIKQI